MADITKNAIPLLAALLATFVADRHIVFIEKNREYDQILEIAQITHRYIAITRDLKNKVSFLKKMYVDGGHHIATFTTIIDSIEKRYESLFENDAYKYLNGKTIDNINSMSAEIFALTSIISIMKESTLAKSNLPFPSNPFQTDGFDKLTNKIESLLQDIFELRLALE